MGLSGGGRSLEVRSGHLLDEMGLAPSMSSGSDEVMRYDRVLNYDVLCPYCASMDWQSSASFLIDTWVSSPCIA